MNNADDASLAAFLESEAGEPPMVPYRTYVSRVLLLAAHALEEQWPAPRLEAELDYAFAMLQDAVAPADPSIFRDRVCFALAQAIRTNDSHGRFACRSGRLRNELRLIVDSTTSGEWTESGTA